MDCTKPDLGDEFSPSDIHGTCQRAKRLCDDTGRPAREIGFPKSPAVTARRYSTNELNCTARGVWKKLQRLPPAPPPPSSHHSPQPTPSTHTNLFSTPLSLIP